MTAFLDISNAMFELICVLIFMGGISYFISSFIVLIFCSLYKIIFKKAVFRHTQNQFQLLVTTCFTGYLAYSYCIDYYPPFVLPVILTTIIVLGFILGSPEFKKKKKHHSPKSKSSTFQAKKNIQAVSFDTAFVSQIGQDPVSYLRIKLNSGSDPGAIQNLFEIIEAEIEKKNHCKSPGFDFYYTKAIIQKETKNTPSSPSDTRSPNLVYHVGIKEHPLSNMHLVNKAQSVSIPSPLPKEPKNSHPSYGHDTLKGEKVKSYDEAVIANMLYREGIKYEYERLVQLEDHFVRPDFAIPISPNGDIIYWEHCGMLNDTEYRANWRQKKEAYQKCNIVEGKNLIVTHGTEPYVLNRIIADIHTQINTHTGTPVN